MLLRLGLALADRIAPRLPARVAYGLADLGGRIWHRVAPGRRRGVAANLARVCAATGRPTRGPAFNRLVRQAFIEHARYYLELVRAPHYPPDHVAELVTADDWDHWLPRFRSGVVAATLHFGNFEPFGAFLAAHGISGVAPVEEIRPPELFEFIRRRRGSGQAVEMIPLGRSRRRLMEATRAGELVALVADRDPDGRGVPVTFFGHPTTMPAGPAFLALAGGRPLVVARCKRTGMDRFSGRTWLIPTPDEGTRDTRIAAMTAEMARHFEAAIAETPEQWWGAFQPYWPDLGRTAASR